MKKRRKARELALKALFQMDITKDFSENSLEVFWNSDLFKFYPEEIKEFANKIIRGVIKHKKEIDKEIEKVAINWKIPRMAVVDRNILRAGVFELLYCDDIPPKATINEYIEIAKKYGNTKSSKFVNGILDKIYKNKKSG